MTDNNGGLQRVRAIGFDTMGTLVDERAGVYAAFKPVLSHLPANITSQDLDEAFDATVNQEMKSAQPKTPYRDIMAEAFRKTTTSLSSGRYLPTHEESLTFADALTEWPAFPDTVAALQTLSKDCKLVLVSNMDTTSLQIITTKGALKDVNFAALIGSDISEAFKPDRKVNQTLLDHVQEHFGIPKDDVMLVANGLTSDHVPAVAMGIRCCFIDRNGQGEEGLRKAGVRPTYVFDSLADLVAERKKKR